MSLLSSVQSGGRCRTTELDLALAEGRSAIWVLLGFSLAINLLMLASPLYMLQVYDRVLATGRIETLALLTGMVALALLTYGLLEAMRSNVMVRLGIWFNARLGPILLSNAVRTRVAGDAGGGQALRDLTQVQGFLSSQGMTMFFDAPWTVIFLALIWPLHPLLGIVAVGAAIALLTLSLLNELVTRKATQNANNATIAAQQQAESTIRNAEVVRAMGMFPTLSARWQDTNSLALRATRSAAERGALILGFSKFMRFFVQSAILGLGAYLVLRGEVSGGAMIASSILLGRALAPVEAAMATWRNFVAARLAYERLKARVQVVPAELERIRLPEPYGNVTLDRVSFSHAGIKEPILSNISLQIGPGEAVAVIGPSASGKSTLCRVLTGIVPPSAGEIRLDGSELSHWNSEELGTHIGYLPQDVELFPGTISENIARMGKAEDQKIIEAAMLANAHGLIQSLPQGYETQIGDGGSRLSGGQRQRIGLARAVYGNPRIIVLDEPNANLDQAGEAALAAAIAKLKAAGVALFIIGHRPSTLACADRIIFLKDGRIEMQGERDDILRRLRNAVVQTPKIIEDAQPAANPALERPQPTDSEDASPSAAA